MNTLKSRTTIFVLFVAIIWFLAPIIQAEATQSVRLAGTFYRNFELSESPQLVSLTGTLYPAGEKHVPGMYNIRVYLQGKERWIFHVKRARDISGMEPGLTIINHLFPSTLHFWGPKNLITSLENPKLAGKPIKIEGQIYVAYNELDVVAINNVS
jgi:hypothetical protein